MPSMPWRCLETNCHYRDSLGPSHRLPYCGYADCTYESIGIPSKYAPAIDAILSSVLMPITRTCSQVTVEQVLIHPRADAVKTRIGYGDHNSIAGYWRRRSTDRNHQT